MEGYLILSRVAVRILLISPVAHVLEPVRRRCTIIGCECIAGGVVAIVVGTCDWVPKSALVAVIFERTLRKIDSWYCMIVGSEVNLVNGCSTLFRNATYPVIAKLACVPSRS